MVTLLPTTSYTDHKFNLRSTPAGDFQELCSRRPWRLVRQGTGLPFNCAQPSVQTLHTPISAAPSGRFGSRPHPSSTPRATEPGPSTTGTVCGRQQSLAPRGTPLPAAQPLQAPGGPTIRPGGHNRIVAAEDPNLSRLSTPDSAFPSCLSLRSFVSSRGPEGRRCSRTGASPAVQRNYRSKLARYISASLGVRVIPYLSFKSSNVISA